MKYSARKTLVTACGMYCLWNSSSFKMITDYDSWEQELLEDNDIEKHILKGNFVPINLHTDGAYEFEVRVGAENDIEKLSKREEQYLIATSDKYKIICDGKLCFSGLEYPSDKIDAYVGVLEIDSGEYSVEVNIIAWDEEPNAKDSAGNISENALPDFVIIVNPAKEGETYRTSVETYDKK